MLTKTEIRIEPRKLITILEKVFGAPVSELVAWEIKPLGGGLEQGHRLFRLSGKVTLSDKAALSDKAHIQIENGTHGILHPWSLVLKIVHPTSTSANDPQGHHYWKREALAYQSGFLEELSCGLTAPRCYQVSQEGEEYWLWLEEVQDDLGKPWSITQHYEVARNLGCFNGVYLMGKPLPDQPWLSRHWLRKYVEDAAPVVQILPELRKLPLFQRSFPYSTDDFFLETWKRRGIFLESLERLPQTFCHQDAFAGNLFWHGNTGEKGIVKALDWSYTGIAAVGEELAPLIVMSSFDLNAQQLLETCLEGYLAGLAESGWSGDPMQVHFSVLATSFYRYQFGATFGELWAGLRDESNHAAIAAAFGLPNIEVLCDILGAQNRLFQEIYAQSNQLLERIA